jgi:hypothetical protein
VSDRHLDAVSDVSLVEKERAKNKAEAIKRTSSLRGISFDE